MSCIQGHKRWNSLGTKGTDERFLLFFLWIVPLSSCYSCKLPYPFFIPLVNNTINPFLTMSLSVLCLSLTSPEPLWRIHLPLSFISVRLVRINWYNYCFSIYHNPQTFFIFPLNFSHSINQKTVVMVVTFCKSHPPVVWKMYFLVNHI